jgi:hypothetical protein
MHRRGRLKRKTARLFIRGRAASWRLVVQPFACLRNKRRDSLAQGFMVFSETGNNPLGLTPRRGAPICSSTRRIARQVARARDVYLEPGNSGVQTGRVHPRTERDRGAE